jgi:hypothetical protein
MTIKILNIIFMKKNNKLYRIILACNNQVNKVRASMKIKNDQIYLVKIYMDK